MWELFRSLEAGVLEDAHFFFPGEESLDELGDHFWVLGGDILFLGDVVFDVEELDIAAAVADELLTLRRAREGTRNDALNRAAFSIFGFVKGGHIGEDFARAKLEEFALESGLRLPEIRSTIDSAANSALPREVPK